MLSCVCYNAKREPAIKIKYANVIGKKIFQPKFINWSYLKRGNAALTQTKIKEYNVTLPANQNVSGMIAKKFKGANQPPKKSIVFSPDIINILLYSPKKNIANVIEEYSTL